MKPLVSTLLACLLAALPGQAQPAPRPWLDPSKPAEARTDLLLKEMSLEEKCALCVGTRAFFVRGLPRLGIPEVTASDGPTGVGFMRPASVYPNRCPSTSYPANIAWAASFNPEVARTNGEVLGREDRARGIGIHLAPGMNLYRMPVAGRNFEYLGEDPFLAGVQASAFIQGIQSQGVIATAKHFCGNNQEFDRDWTSSDIDERTLRELYLPAFERAVKEGGAWAVMCAYNPVNGTQMSENKALLEDLLKREWGFRGFVMSDWGAVRRVVEPALAGLDLEMDFKYKWGDGQLLQAVKEGKVPASLIDDKVRRILRAYVSMGFLDRPQLVPGIPVYSAEGSRAALRTAREGMVLLKNEGILPLDRARVKRIAVIGPNAAATHALQGGGSAEVTAHRRIDTLTGLVMLAGEDALVSYASGTEPAEAATLAARADVAVLCVGFDASTESEGEDRSFGLPKGQDALIQAVAAANPNTVVVLNAGGNVDMAPWIDRVKGLLMAWYPGQEGGRAVAELLFGDVNPSGRLPVSFERHLEDNPCFRSYWDPGKTKRVAYREGVFMGYRGLDAKGVAPRFPFGFGLGYTTFRYGEARASVATLTGDQAVTVTVPVTNTGKRAGAEVVQLYVHDTHTSVPRPPQELKGFAKLTLKPGETGTATFTLRRRDLSYWDVARHAWTAEPGRFELRIGASSRDIRARLPLDYQETK